jgi:uncharacterized Tic20 family protein
MSESQTVPGDEKIEIPPQTAEKTLVEKTLVEKNLTEQVDPAWLLALPHFLGAFSLFTAYLGFLCPLFYWLAKKDEDAQIAGECRKALSFQGAYLIFTLVFSVLLQIATVFVSPRKESILFLTVFGHVSVVVSLMVFGFSILAGYKVLNNQPAKYPLAFDLITIFTKRRSAKK